MCPVLWTKHTHTGNGVLKLACMVHYTWLLNVQTFYKLVVKHLNESDHVHYMCYIMQKLSHATKKIFFFSGEPILQYTIASGAFICSFFPLFLLFFNLLVAPGGSKEETYSFSPAISSFLDGDREIQ